MSPSVFTQPDLAVDASNSQLPTRRQFLTSTLAAAVLSVGPFSRGWGQSSPLRIGLSGPYSGGSAPMGESMRNGVRLAVNELNYIGGVLGRPLELVERDDQANPQVGAAIAEDLVLKDKVVATIGIVNTGVGMASIDTYQKHKIPLLVAVSTGPALTKKYAPAADQPNAPDNYIFRLSPTLTLEAQIIMEDMAKRGFQQVALLADATAYGDAGVKAVGDAANAKGVALSSIERFKVGDTDMTEQLRRARATKAQALILWGIGPELAAIARGVQQLGWKVLLVGGWTLSMANFIDGAGSAGEGALMTQTFIQEGGVSSKNSFLLAYASTFKTGRIASPMSAAQGYDAMLLLAAALWQAGSTEGKAIVQALENLQKRVPGAITVYEKPFTRLDHDAVTPNMLVMGQVKQGRVVYAYSEDARRGLLQRKKQG
ncbi:ABC transporter substrate-binding protein [Parvibium lacunae]|uniref:Amino acid ABC transporter substrate-binding protein n=1 Tax=Parvibium lacunae TaxID=1888893 RepID=A0A368L773_9BURK|nr:ABC transporter substrate-binding protein [Parvibium lacunae]RCS59476.1 amino acid ABC transporter substrate-binding protein [Parvibium lacunae]